MKKRLFAAIVLALGLLLLGTETALAGFTCYYCWSSNTIVVHVGQSGGSGVGYSPLYHCYLNHCQACYRSFWVDELHNDNGIDPAVAPTCTEKGWNEGKKCTVCDKPINRDFLMPTGHTLVVDAAVAPTCTETGLTEGCHCSVCTTVIALQELIPATGHTEVMDQAIAPTCTETGLTVGCHCSVCGTVIDAPQVVEAEGHTEVIDKAIAPTCTQTGLCEGSHCSVCGAVIAERKIVPALGHQYKIVETVAPTCLRGGYSLMRCVRCGDEYKANIKERLSHWYGPWSPAGDGTHTSECVRCGHTASASCEPGTITMDGLTLSACAVCGALSGEGSLPTEGLTMAAVDGAGIEKTPGNELPSGGELVARSADGPMGENSRVLRLYTLAFELAGKTLETEPLSVSLPLSVEFPSFRLVCVSGPDAGMEIPFEIKDGTLIFTATLPGMFALMRD